MDIGNFVRWPKKDQPYLDHYYLRDLNRYEKTARRRPDVDLKEVLFVEEDSQFRLCSDPAALFACLKQPIHQCLTGHFPAACQMRLDVMAGRSGLVSKGISLIRSELQPVFFEVEFFVLAHSYCLILISDNKYSPRR